MARTWYGGTPGDAVAVPDVDGNLDVGSGPFTVWDAATAGTQLTDLMDRLGDPVEEVSTDARGMLLFQGPDDYTAALWIEDGTGYRWRIDPADLADRVGGGSGAWDDITGKPAYIAAGSSQASARSAIGAASASTWVQTNLLGQTSAAAVIAALGLEDFIQDYLDQHNYKHSFVASEDGSFPASASQGDELLLIAGEVAGSITYTQLVASTTTGTGPYVTGAITAGGADTVAFAHVSAYLNGATSGSPAPYPTAFTAGGLTWTAVPGTDQVSNNGQLSSRVYKGTGTGTTTQASVTYGSAVTSCHVRIVKVANATGTVRQARAVSPASALNTPMLTFNSPVLGTSSVLSFLTTNSQAMVPTPGTGYAEIVSGSQPNSSAHRISAEVAVPGTNSPQWTTSGSYQSIITALEIS